MFKEMLSDETGHWSSGRVIYFGTFLISSVVVLLAAYRGTLTEGILLAYIGAPAAAYGVASVGRAGVMKITAGKTEVSVS